MIRSFSAFGILAGTIIGAGIFSLPYLFRELGILWGVVYLIAFMAVYFFIHYMYARVLEKNPGKHQFFYLAKKYLPHSISRLGAFGILGELILALTVYLILAPTFANLIFPNLSHSSLIIGFWFLSSIFIFVGISYVSLAEIAGILGILGVVGIIFASGYNNPLQVDFIKNIDWKIFFLPFGPLLFSFAGRPAIHKVMEEYNLAKEKGEPFSLKKIIFWGTLIPALIYLLFVVGILKLNPNISPEAMNSLGFLSSNLLMLLGVLGLITLWTSYFVIGANVRDILREDLRVSKLFSAIIVLGLPLFLYFVGFNNFLGVVSFTGGFFLSLEGIFVTRMWQKCFEKTAFHFSSLLYVIFSASIVCQIISNLF